MLNPQFNNSGRIDTMSSIMIRKINGFLKTENMCKVIHYYDDVKSTNDVLTNLANKGASEGTTVIAECQTKGKGRLDRTWISPGGANLYISVLLRPHIAPGTAPMLTLLTSVALKEAITKTGVENSFIKWPNDIHINGKKVAGILTEMSADNEKVKFVIIGIGVNINMSRNNMNSEFGSVSRIATSIQESIGKEIDRAMFASDLLLELETRYGVFKKRGRKHIVSAWETMWGGKDKAVKVSLVDGSSYEGIARGVNEAGHLLVEIPEGEIKSVIAGDVTELRA